VELVSEETNDRTCVGCRRKDDPAALLRLAVSPEPPFVAPDLGVRGGRARPGRGLSVHPRLECIRAAAERGGIARSLRRAVQIDGEGLARAAAAAYARRCDGLLLAAGRRRLLTVGTDVTREALSQGRLEALVVAEDAAGRRDEVLGAAARLGCHALVFSTKERLGRLFGREEVGVLGILDAGIASEVVACGQHAMELSVVGLDATGSGAMDELKVAPPGRDVSEAE
jgi:predicted RNA-binding protein YlxR (DUF448 family)/ribosomal protein L7Ae-like RNA K-turn-binding protein